MKIITKTRLFVVPAYCITMTSRAGNGIRTYVHTVDYACTGRPSIGHNSRFRSTDRPRLTFRPNAGTDLHFQLIHLASHELTLTLRKPPFQDTGFQPCMCRAGYSHVGSLTTPWHAPAWNYRNHRYPIYRFVGNQHQALLFLPRAALPDPRRAFGVCTYLLFPRLWCMYVPLPVHANLHHISISRCISAAPHRSQI